MVENFNNTKVAFDSKTENELRKALFLFKLAGNKTLVKIGTTILDMASSFNLPIKGIIKSTIFNHFCGGENIKECKIVIEKLGKRNVKTIGIVELSEPKFLGFVHQSLKNTQIYLFVLTLKRHDRLIGPQLFFVVELFTFYYVFEEVESA